MHTDGGCKRLIRTLSQPWDVFLKQRKKLKFQLRIDHKIRHCHGEKKKQTNKQKQMEVLLSIFPHLGRFSIKDVVPNKEGESSKIKVKVRLNIHGILNVVNASLVEKLPAVAEPEAESMEVEGQEDKTKEAAGDAAPEVRRQRSSFLASLGNLQGSRSDFSCLRVTALCCTFNMPHWWRFCLFSRLIAFRTGVILASQSSVFSWWKLQLPSLILTAAEDWGEKKFWTNVMSKGQKEGDGRGRGNAFLARQISSTSRLYKIPLPSWPDKMLVIQRFDFLRAVMSSL